MTQSLLLFTFGPVQSFIAQARKTQDLYAGSYLLSHLARTAAQAMQASGGQLIFPDVEYASLPNRLLALYETTEQEEQEGIGLAIEKAVRREFEEIGEHILNALSLAKPREFDSQLKKHLEIYWVFHPLSNDTYLEDYNSLTAYLGAVKRTRIFGQLIEAGPKCTIGGEHNVVFYRKKKSNKRFRTGLKLPDQIPQKFMKDGEGLGAVNFIKRCAEIYFEAQPESDFEKEFPSTARVAFMDTWHRLDQKEPEKIWPWQGIEDHQNFEMIENNGNFPDIEVDEASREAYERVRSHKVCPYYAIVCFDGDDMGKLYGTSDIKRETSPLDFHKELSRKLQRFAKVAAKEVIVWPKGQVVYAGGEDFLGFLNLKHLFEVMIELRERFGQIDLAPFTDEKLTFSAGIAIAHFKSPPLYEVLKWARRMEQAAKDIDSGKDAFGLAVIKRSGEVNSSVYKWRADNQWLPQIYNELVGHLQRRDFSPFFIRYLSLSLSRLISDDGYFEGDEQIVKAEIKRLVGRASLLTEKKKENMRAFGDGGDATTITIEEMVNKVEMLYKNSQSQGISNFLDALNIVAFLERVMEP